MHPRGALCGCCENTILWKVETVLYGCWSKVGRSRLSNFLKGCPRGSSGGIGRLLIVISMCDRTLLGLRVVVLRCANRCRGGRLRKEVRGN